jgi:hypothetical protein
MEHREERTMDTESINTGGGRGGQRRLRRLGAATAAVAVLGTTAVIDPVAAAEPIPTQVAAQIAEMAGTDVGSVESEILRVVHQSGASPVDAAGIVLDDHIEQLNTSLAALAVVSSADLGGIQSAARNLSALREELRKADPAADSCGPGGEVEQLSEALAAIGSVSSFDVTGLQAHVQELSASCITP